MPWQRYYSRWRQLFISHNVALQSWKSYGRWSWKKSCSFLLIFAAFQSLRRRNSVVAQWGYYLIFTCRCKARPLILSTSPPGRWCVGCYSFNYTKAVHWNQSWSQVLGREDVLQILDYQNYWSGFSTLINASRGRSGRWDWLVRVGGLRVVCPTHARTPDGKQQKLISTYHGFGFHLITPASETGNNLSMEIFRVKRTCLSALHHILLKPYIWRGI
jgi:hypothetical protein